jgi:hypothetical protein
LFPRVPAPALKVVEQPRRIKSITHYTENNKLKKKLQKKKLCFDRKINSNASSGGTRSSKA